MSLSSWAAVALLAAASILSSPFAIRSPWILAALGTLNALIGATHSRIAADHPLRIIGPLLVLLAAYVEMAEEGRSPRAYAVALCIFGLGGSAMFAPAIFAKWNQWAMPTMTIVVCIAICAISLAPKGAFRWLRY